MNQPLQEYLKNKETKHNMPFRIMPTGESGYLLANCCLISEDEVNAMYPVMEKVSLWNDNYKGKNPDGTAI